MSRNPIDAPMDILAEQTRALASVAESLERTRQRGSPPEALAAALTSAVELWTAINTTATTHAAALPPTISNNLVRLSDYVVGTIFRHGVHLPAPALDALIDINAQIAVNPGRRLRGEA